MTDQAQVLGSKSDIQAQNLPLSEPCVMVIFGASGDLTRRLLMPALYNLKCDHLLSDQFAIIGAGRKQYTDDEFRQIMGSDENGLQAFHTRQHYDESAANDLLSRCYFESGSIDDPAYYQALKTKVTELNQRYDCQCNVLFYFAMAPRFFGAICDRLHEAGFQQSDGWSRIIVEKPFGTDLASAQALNQSILKHWDEEQIFRIDHYLGKETVQNLLAFRFSNGMFEPLWNSQFIDNIQFNVCEAVDVGERGGYYDKSGVMRDMMQNHMFQMLAYLCMEPPGSFEPDSIRNEKAKLLESVRIYQQDEVPDHVVRGQYGSSFNADGTIDQPGYRQSKDVDPESKTETFAAAKLFVDNWRWNGVPVYLRSGKGLWKRSTEIIVEFKKAPVKQFRGTDINHLASNRLVFKIQPYQGIELLFQAKTPGPRLQLQNVDMAFNYGDNFKTSRYTGYEVMLYSCSRGDATLFSRGDLVEAAWKIAQPIMDYWQSAPADDFPNYNRNSWGPKAASSLLEKDGRRWFEVVTPDMLQKAPIFENADPLLLNSVIMALRSVPAAEGEEIIKLGDMAKEMFLICHGEVEIINAAGEVVQILKDGDFFGEIGILLSTPRTATVKARSLVDMFVLNKSDFSRILQDHPQFASNLIEIAKNRYDITVSSEQLLAEEPVNLDDLN